MSTMDRPRLLDLFCRRGRRRPWATTAPDSTWVGVDIEPQTALPVPVHSRPTRCARAPMRRGPLFRFGPFDAIHASPPCQFFTQMRASWRAQGVNDGYVDLLTPTLARMRKLDMPWVVENVVGAGKAMNATLMRHGGMFGMGIHRPRLFESNVLLLAPRAPLTKSPIGVYDKGPRTVTHYRTRLNGNGKGRSEMRIARTLDEARELMGACRGLAGSAARRPSRPRTPSTSERN